MERPRKRGRPRKMNARSIDDAMVADRVAPLLDPRGMSISHTIEHLGTVYEGIQMGCPTAGSKARSRSGIRNEADLQPWFFEIPDQLMKMGKEHAGSRPSSLGGDNFSTDQSTVRGISDAEKQRKRGSGENKRRDDDVDAPEEEAEEEDEGNKDDFDWEAVVEEAVVEGESGSGEKFYDAEDKNQSSPEVNEEIPAAAPQSSAQQKE
ncbi:hypothetical protein Dimus_007312 [Dionaea muscipula]